MNWDRVEGNWKQRTPNASVVGQGFAEPAARSTARSPHRAANSRWTSSSILPDVVIGRDRPELLGQIVRLHFDSLGYTPADLAKFLCVHERELVFME
jgi:hypothetical protein